MTLETILTNMTVKIFQKLQANLVPVGSIIAMPQDTTIPYGYLVCDGDIYSSTTYPKLAEVCVNFLQEETAEGYFNVPDFRGKILKGSALSETDPTGYSTETLNNDSGIEATEVAKICYYIKHDQ